MRNSTANTETITVARPLLEFAAGFDTGILGCGGDVVGCHPLGAVAP
ncbi:MAG: hypothetical protein WA815_16495 [Terracidiphilus sp.]